MSHLTKRCTYSAFRDSVDVELFDSAREPNAKVHNQKKTSHEDGIAAGDAPRTFEPSGYLPSVRDSDHPHTVAEAIHASASTGNAAPVKISPPGIAKPGDGVPTMSFTGANPFLPWLPAFGSAPPSMPSTYVVPLIQHPAIYATQYYSPHVYWSGTIPSALPATSSIPHEPQFSSHPSIISTIQQQDQEIRRMEAQLEAQRVAESQRQEENEFIKLQERLAAVQVPT